MKKVDNSGEQKEFYIDRKTYEGECITEVLTQRSTQRTREKIPIKRKSKRKKEEGEDAIYSGITLI